MASIMAWRSGGQQIMVRKARSRSVKSRSSAPKSNTQPARNSAPTRAESIAESLRKRGFKADALLYVRDRLGHASITTTQIYLHMLEQLDIDLMLLHEQELGELI